MAPLSLFYRIGYWVDKALGLKNRVRLPRLVISVGNLTVGGTGKTPFVVQLTQELAALGRRPAVLTRGYRGVFRKSVPSSVVLENSSFVSDEVALMQERLEGIPIGAGPRRDLTAQEILKKHPIDVFVLDDGFQHWALDRDLDLVLVDATDPWGGGHLLPWGLLREPLRAIKRADAVFLTRTELVSKADQLLLLDQIKERAGASAIFRTHFVPELMTTHNFRIPIAFLKGKKVVAFSGIGNPRAFEQFLENQGSEVSTRRFRDHATYGENDILALFNEARKSHSLLVTTEKDWMKIKRIPRLLEASLSKNLYILQIDLAFDPEDVARWKGFLTARLR